MDQAVSFPPPTAEVWVRSQVSMYEICGGQGDGGTGPPAPYPYIDFPLPVLFHLCSVLICTYMLLLPDGETGKAWEPSKNPEQFWVLEGGGALDRKVISLGLFYSFEVIQLKEICSSPSDYSILLGSRVYGIEFLRFVWNVCLFGS